jgi:hypothetical protein
LRALRVRLSQRTAATQARYLDGIRVLRDLMKEKRVLAAYTAPPRPATVEGADVLGEADALRTVHHVLHASSNIKMWQRAGQRHRMTLNASPAEEAQLVRASEARFSCDCGGTDVSRNLPARRLPQAGPPCRGSCSRRPAALAALRVTLTVAPHAPVQLFPTPPRRPRGPRTTSACAC